MVLYVLYLTVLANFRLLGINRKFLPLYNLDDDAELECRQIYRTKTARL